MYGKFLLIEKPEAFHEDLVVSGHTRCGGKCFGGIDVAACFIKVEEDVV